MMELEFYTGVNFFEVGSIEYVSIKDESRCVYCDRLKLSSTVYRSELFRDYLDDTLVQCVTYQYSCSNYHFYRAYCVCSSSGKGTFYVLKEAIRAPNSKVVHVPSKFETVAQEYLNTKIQRVYEVYKKLKEVPGYVEPDTGVAIEDEKRVEFHWKSVGMFLEFEIERNLITLSHISSDFRAKLYGTCADEIERLCKRVQKYLKHHNSMNDVNEMLKKLTTLNSSSSKSKIPYKNRCPKCDSDFLHKSEVMLTTIADYPPVVIDGVQHTHDANSVTCRMKCSNSHSFEVYTEGYTCSVGECNVVKRSYVRLLKD